jgi:hemolysin activation/secretion protein
MRRPTHYSLYLSIVFVVYLVMPVYAQAVAVPRSAEADVIGKQSEKIARPKQAPLLEETSNPIVNAPAGSEKVHFTLKKLIIEGSTTYSQETLQKYYARYIGKEISIADMYSVAAHVTQRYLDDGYFISKAYLPPQKISNGIVHIRVVEGYIKQITWKGDALDSSIAHGMADKLLLMHPLRGLALESTVISINELAGVQIQATLAPGKQDGAVEIVFDVTRKRVSASIEANNYASRYVGVWQSNAQASLAGILTPIDSISLNGASSLNPQFARYERGEYSLPINTYGTALRLGGSRSHTAPSYTLENLDIRSNAQEYWMGAKQPIIRSRAESLTISSQFYMHNQQTDIISQRFYTDRIRALQFGGLYTLADGWEGANIMDVELFKGLNILSPTSPGSAGLSRPKGQSDFSKITYNISRLQSINNNFSLLAVTAGQFSNAPLLSSEQMGYGGSVLGRGYDPSEINGDEGIAGSLELRHNSVINADINIQPYAFVDTGKVWDHNIPGNAKSAVSSGIGSRVQLFTRAQLDIFVAKPLTLPAATPKLGADNNDPRIGASLHLNY